MPGVYEVEILRLLKRVPGPADLVSPRIDLVKTEGVAYESKPGVSRMNFMLVTPNFELVFRPKSLKSTCGQNECVKLNFFGF